MASIPDITSTPTHPAWCDPRLCSTVPDGGELLVVHRAVVLDDEDRGVGIIRADATDPDGTLRSSDPVRVTLDLGAEDITPDAAFALARSIAAAAALAAGVAPLPVGGEA